MEPAFPEGLPTRRPVTPASQKASHPCDLGPEGAHCHGGRSQTHMSRQDGQRFWLDPLLGRLVWSLTCEVTHLQQPHSKRRQPAQPADQALGTLHLAFLDAAARFEAVMIVLYSPPGAIPLGALPALLTG